MDDGSSGTRSKPHRKQEHASVSFKSLTESAETSIVIKLEIIDPDTLGSP